MSEEGITLARLPESASPGAETDVVLLGVPTEEGTEGKAGTSEGPSSVRRMSESFGSYSQALGLDIFERLTILDGGDIEPETSGLEALTAAVSERVFGCCRGGQIPGLVGGSSAISLGALRGMVRAKRRPVSLLQLTASHRMRAGHAGEFGWMARAHQEGLLRRGSVLQIGVRGPSKDALESQEAFRAGFERLSMDDVRWDIHASMETIRKWSSGSAIYVSVDLGCLDPSVCPGVTQAVPGGLSTWEMQQIIRALVGADILGFDVVGLCPARDYCDLTSGVAVTVLHEVLAVVTETRETARISVTGGSIGRTSA